MFHFSFNQNKLWTDWRSNRALLYNKPSILYQWKYICASYRHVHFGNLIFSLVPSDNRNTRSTCPMSVFTGIGQTLMSRPAPVFWWDLCCSSFHFLLLSYYLYLRSEFRGVMSVTISALKMMFGSSLPPVVCRRNHVLFIYVICVCLHVMVANTYCVVFLFCFS